MKKIGPAVAVSLALLSAATLLAAWIGESWLLWNLTNGFTDGERVGIVMLVGVVLGIAFIPAIQARMHERIARYTLE